tara:strand:+ start:1882 stop:2157 length:276 start_codon:yes stop_codon:yes gene_type:complete
MVEIEVACILNEKIVVKKLSVESGTTIAKAIVLSEIEKDFPNEDISGAAKGVFGVIRNEDWLLEDGDRVEIYQPLKFDPREARRRRAAKQK